MLGIAQKQKDLALKAQEKPYHRIGTLFPMICQKEWMLQAMWNVLHNQGAKTAGIDGEIKARYYDAKTNILTQKAIRQVEEICRSLEDGTYRPKPVRRVYIPKANGKMRPIGIPTLIDRTVQEAIRMAIEPLYESDFLDCSYGFRPNRCTMDAVSVCTRMMQPRMKYYWVIEGDIKGCFDNVDHKVLMKLLRRRISDRKLTDTIYKLLKAGYEEEGVMYKTGIGTPQGGIISPLLANIYLHELDIWWRDNYYCTSRHRFTRRKKGLANFMLVRYADDFIILSNGTKEATTEMKVEVANYLANELRLELSQEKTKVTHVDDGFDFLGFHVRRFRKGKGVMIKPTKGNIQRMRDKISGILSRKNHEASVVGVISVLNRIIRGWTNYYRFVNSAKVFNSLDYYLGMKFQKWYRGKYRMPSRKGTVKANEWMNDSSTISLIKFQHTKVKRYRWKSHSNPYLDMDLKKRNLYPSGVSEWYGKADRDADLRLECIKRDQGVCQICRRPKINLIAHHVIPLSEGGEDSLDNLVTICKDCEREYYRELHLENRRWKEVKQLGGSRVR